MRIAIAGLALTAISTIVAILTMPEVRDILGLDTPGSHRDSTGVDEFSPPDPAFDPLLATLGEMTEAPVMLPARLPDEMDTPVLDGFATDSERYEIDFSIEHTEETVASLSNAETLGSLQAYREEEDLSNEFFEAQTTEEIELPDGTDATLRYMVPVAGRGVSQGPFWEGEFDAHGYTYVLIIIKPDMISEDGVKQALSTMVFAG